MYLLLLFDSVFNRLLTCLAGRRRKEVRTNVPVLCYKLFLMMLQKKRTHNTYKHTDACVCVEKRRARMRNNKYIACFRFAGCCCCVAFSALIKLYNCWLFLKSAAFSHTRTRIHTYFLLLLSYIFVSSFRLHFQFATLCLIFNCFALLLSLFPILFLFVLIYLIIVVVAVLSLLYNAMR